MSDKLHKNRPPKQHYRTTNWHEYDAALTARGSLLVWFDKDMQWFSERRGKNGRPAKYSDAAISFCLSLKCLFNMPLRQSLGLVGRSGYHRRSLVETKMHCFKRLGSRVMARTFDRQVAELQVRAALLNRFTALGCPKTVAVTAMA